MSTIMELRTELTSDPYWATDTTDRTVTPTANQTVTPQRPTT
jgi:hypothetical protein